MQQRDDQPPVSGRPSLLSAEQQAEADRARAARLAAADSAATPAPVKRRKPLWIAAAGAALVCAGAAWWTLDERQHPVVARGPQTVAGAITGAPASVKTAADPEVSASAILGENPPPVAHTGFSLKDLLSAPASGDKKAARRDPEELSKLLESAPAASAPVTLASGAAEAASPVREEKADSDKADSTDKPEKTDKADKTDKVDKPEASNKSAGSAQVLAKATAKQKKAAAAKALLAKSGESPKPSAQQSASKTKPGAKTAQKPLTREQKAREVKLAAAKKPVARQAKQAPARPETIDSDVALIAALVKHSQRERASFTRAFKDCQAGSPAQARGCKARLCTSDARNEPACKAIANVRSGPDGALPN